MHTRNTQQRAIGVGLVGYGFGGSVFHAPIIARTKGLELRGIMERSRERALNDYPSVAVCRSVEELLNREDIDLVVISTPNSTHFTIGKAALNSGKHVVMDKPMTITSGESLELKTTAQVNGLILSPYHNRRWDRDFRTATGVIKGGRLGDITEFSSYFDLYRPYPTPNAWRERPEPGSGLLYDLGSHLLDQAFTLFGEPISISANLARERKGSLVDDAFTLILEYNGFQATLGAALSRGSPRPRFAISGTRGFFPRRGVTSQLGRAGGTWIIHRLAPLLEEAKQYRWLQNVAAAATGYRHYYENIRDAILGRATLAVTPDDGWRVVRAIELAIESDRRTVALPWRR